MSAFRLRLAPLFPISVNYPPVFPLPKSSTMSKPSAGHQPRALGHTSGNHTPRHVQWASAVDEEEVAAGQRDHDLENEIGSTHELDEAGLEVRTVSSLLSCSLVLLFAAIRLPNTFPCS